jgi:flagellar motility protein MotE (MotC chaperone)
MMSDRQAAAVLTSMSAARAAAITKGSPTKAPGGSQ